MNRQIKESNISFLIYLKEDIRYMNLNENTISAQNVITIVLFVIAVINFYTAVRNNSKKKIEKETEQNVKINWKLDQLCKSIDDIKIESKNTSKILETINFKIISLEKDNMINSNEIDELKTRVKKLEEK